jgi:hypothetical protein
VAGPLAKPASAAVALTRKRRRSRAFSSHPELMHMFDLHSGCCTAGPSAMAASFFYQTVGSKDKTLEPSHGILGQVDQHLPG